MCGTDNGGACESNADVTSISARWLQMEQLLKQKSIEHQQSERLMIIKDYAGEIDTLLNQNAILSGSKQKNEQKLARFKVEPPDGSQWSIILHFKKLFF